jgi:hypothetical protein
MTKLQIKLTSNVMIEGKIVKAGATVEVPRTVALDLVARSRAEHIAAPAPAPAAEEPEPEQGKGKKGKAVKAEEGEK